MFRRLMNAGRIHSGNLASETRFPANFARSVTFRVIPTTLGVQLGGHSGRRENGNVRENVVDRERGVGRRRRKYPFAE